MLNLSKITKDWLTERYLFANTASYLIKHFRSTPALEQLSKSKPADELISFIKSVEGMEKPSCPEIVDGYAALIALTFKPTNEWEAAFTGFVFRVLQWGPQIINYYKQNMLATETISVPSNFKMAANVGASSVISVKIQTSSS